MKLSERDVHRALAVVAAAAADANGTAFGIETVDAIVAAIPADEAAYVEWRFGDGDSIRVARGGAEPPWVEEALAATCASYPLRDLDHAASVEPLRISDVVSRARFRKSPFYVSVMRPLGREHELKLWLPAPPGHARYLELERGRALTSTNAIARSSRSSGRTSRACARDGNAGRTCRP